MQPIEKHVAISWPRTGKEYRELSLLGEECLTRWVRFDFSA